jgi:tRNA(fMet)-specific endonuclease VapC
VEYLLDTNICIAIINRRPGVLWDRLRKHSPEAIKVSVITVAELQYGADKSQAVEKNHKALNKFLAPLTIVDFDRQCVTAYGKIRAALARAGKPIGPLDTLIAAQAITHGLILITNNVQEFSRIPELSLENWLQE